MLPQWIIRDVVAQGASGQALSTSDLLAHTPNPDESLSETVSQVETGAVKGGVPTQETRFAG